MLTKWLTSDRLVEAWSYIRVHLKLFLSLQRVGLMPNQWYPSWKFFIPFTEASPIPPPPPFPGFAPIDLFGWGCAVLISAIPFFSWVSVSRIARDLKPEIWKEVFRLLPSTAFRAKRLPLPPPSPTLEPIRLDNSPVPVEVVREDGQTEAVFIGDDATPLEPPRRASSIFSNRGEGYETEEEDNDGVSATFISFEVEATESTDAPPGQWSAELQPSHPYDGRPAEERQPVYLNTLLTQLPAMFATNIFTNSLLRMLMAPYESFSLRMLARTFLLRRGQSVDHIYGIDLMDGLNFTSVVNFLGVELLQLVVSGELWAVFAGTTQFYHRSEEEWKQDEEDEQRLMGEGTE